LEWVPYGLESQMADEMFAGEQEPTGQTGAPEAAGHTRNFDPTPSGASSSQPGATAAQEQLFEVKTDGQVLKVPLKELLNGYQRQSTFTRKTTELANQRQEFAQAVQEFQAIARDRDRIRQYYREQFGEDIGAAAATQIARQQQGAPAMAGPTANDPEELLTRAQVMQLWKEQEEALRNNWRQEMGEGISQLETERMATEFGKAINAHLGEIFRDNPELSRIPGIANALKAEARMHKPRTLDETKHLISEYAQQKAQAIRDLVASKVGAASVQKQQLNRGILPPGGQVAPPPAPQSFNKIRDPRLKEQILTDLLAGGFDSE
jgi:hypothetical protein